MRSWWHINIVRSGFDHVYLVWHTDSGKRPTEGNYWPKYVCSLTALAYCKCMYAKMQHHSIYYNTARGSARSKICFDYPSVTVPELTTGIWFHSFQQGLGVCFLTDLAAFMKRLAVLTIVFCDKVPHALPPKKNVHPWCMSNPVPLEPCRCLIQSKSWKEPVYTTTGPKV